MVSSAFSVTSVMSGFAEAFPSSRKVHVAGERVSVPMREIALSDGEPPLCVYDTSGPHDSDVRAGLPPLRQSYCLKITARYCLKSTTRVLVEEHHEVLHEEHHEVLLE